MYLAGGGVLTLESLLIRLEIEPLRREKDDDDGSILPREFVAPSKCSSLPAAAGESVLYIIYRQRRN